MVLSRARIAAAASVLFLLVAGAWVLRFRGNDRAEGLRVSGNIEATTVEVSFRIPGRIEIRAVDEGMKVAAGQLVAHLDNADLVDDLRLREAELAEAVRLSKTRLSHAGVYSPLSGTVLSKNAEPGEYVAAGTPVVTIGDLQDVWLRAYIPETELGKVK
ncbi:MAG TPA: efflux RND transporter periplasmic adaptor subunit, partial [Candidatus Deferrimicrobiaceae bacterium]